MDEADRGQDLFTIGELAAAFTLSPRASSARAVAAPIKPAAPVTRTIMAAP